MAIALDDTHNLGHDTSHTPWSTLVHYTYYDCCIGPLLLAGNENGLSLVGFPQESETRKPHPDWSQSRHALARVIEQLDAYFAGELREFDLALEPKGTEFQRAVWSALQRIPYGVTWSYANLAKHIDKPKAVRAVGAANGANPLPVIVPCHRVIGSNGTLTGFGGGLPTKRWLLQHEGALSGDLAL